MKNKFLLTLLLVFFVMNVQAQRKHYDPRMRMTGITEIGKKRHWTSEMGFMFVSNDVDLYISSDLLDGDINEFDNILRSLNNQNAGKKILDFLFKYDGNSLSEDLLKERAYSDANLDDKERAGVSFLNDRKILEEDYLPILQNNYIYVEGKRNWYVFYVKINKEILNEVFNSWNDMNRYNQIHVDVVKVKRGKIPKIRKGRGDASQYKKVGKKVPQFTLRTKVCSRNPFKGGVGSRHGVKNGQRFLVMRTFAKKAKGNDSIPRLYSKKIATVRATTIDRDTTIFHTIAGGGASAKNADVLVYRPDAKFSLLLEPTFQLSNEMWGARLSYIQTVKFLRHGWAVYNMTSGGFNFKMFDKHVKGGDGHEYDFVQSYLTVGPAFGYSFLRRCEIMPYIQIGADYVTTKDKFPDSENDDGTYNYKNNTWAFRAAGGARINVNILYPLQFTAGMEYYFTSGTKIYKAMTSAYGVDRYGLMMFGGLKYNF